MKFWTTPQTISKTQNVCNRSNLLQVKQKQLIQEICQIKFQTYLLALLQTAQPLLIFYVTAYFPQNPFLSKSSSRNKSVSGQLSLFHLPFHVYYISCLIASTSKIWVGGGGAQVLPQTAEWVSLRDFMKRAESRKSFICRSLGLI